MAALTALSTCMPAFQHNTSLHGHDDVAAGCASTGMSAVWAFCSKSNFVGVSSRDLKGGGCKAKNGVPSKYLAATATLTADGPSIKSETDNLGLKTELLSIVAGLDRGLLASVNDETATEVASRKLEAAGEAVELPRDLDLLQGRWRLVYSSGFVTGSLGGQRPGPPVGGLLPLTLGQVYQRINVAGNELDNIVDLRIGTPWPLPPLEVTATLAHTFELTGGNGISIVFEKTIVKPSGSLSQLPPFDTPPLPDFLRRFTNERRGNFDTTYLDEDFRISRGDRGELRIFCKA